MPPHLKMQKQSPGGVLKKGVLRNFATLIAKHLCQGPFFNKVAGLRLNKVAGIRPKFLRTPFLAEHLR